jgi:2-polyprenyl-3-methyl-5-hydroxy-6-metoxy-1,4-benzoquinol methylase
MRFLTRAPEGATVVACAMCSSVRTRHRYTKYGYHIVECRRCGLVYVNPQPALGEVWRRYDRHYFEQEYLPAQGIVDGRVDPSFYDDRYAELLAVLAARLSDKGRMFEVGAGGGLFLSAAARAGWAVSGIELSGPAAQFARESLGLDVVQGPAERMAPAAPPVDVVVMFDVIEHLFDPGRVLATVRSSLRRDGMLVVATPNFHSVSRHALGSQWATLNPLEHLYYFSRPTLRRTLEAHGFADVNFIDHLGAWRVWDTMNARHTHRPGSWRATLYERAVGRWGERWHQRVQARGRGDIILATARAR